MRTNGSNALNELMASSAVGSRLAASGQTALPFSSGRRPIAGRRLVSCATINSSWSVVAALGLFAGAVAWTPGAAFGNFSGGDDFTTVSGSWGADVTLGGGAFTVANGVLNFTTSASSSNEQAARFWTQSTGSYDADWSLRMDVTLGTFDMADGQYAAASMYVQNSGESGGDAVRVALRRDGAASRDFYTDAFANGSSLGAEFVPSASLSQSLAISYDSATRTLRTGYDPNGAAGGYSFVLVGVTDIDEAGSDWHMTPSDQFEVRIYGQTTLPVALGELTFDNFAASSTAVEFVPEPGALVIASASLLALSAALHGRRRA